MKTILIIFFGGGLGSVLRYALQLAFSSCSVLCPFPWSTFCINVLGSFLIGVFYALSARFNLGEEMRLMLTVGLCGGFTTFSTFSNESLALIKSGQWAAFGLYAVLSVVAGILAVLGGNAVVKSFS